MILDKFPWIITAYPWVTLGWFAIWLVTLFLVKGGDRPYLDKSKFASIIGLVLGGVMVILPSNWLALFVFLATGQTIALLYFTGTFLFDKPSSERLRTRTKVWLSIMWSLNLVWVIIQALACLCVLMLMFMHGMQYNGPMGN